MATALACDHLPIPFSSRRSGLKGDVYRIWSEGPILHVHAKGAWDIPAAEAYVQDIGRAVAQQRQIAPKLRALVDRSDTPDFGDGVHERLLEIYTAILRPGDRIGIIVDSSLAKMQIRPFAGREETQLFLSAAAARTWLLAYG